MVHFDLQELFQICRAQSYEIKFKIQQKRPDRQVKKKCNVDLGKDNLLKNIRSLCQDIDVLMIRCNYLIKIQLRTLASFVQMYKNTVNA